MSIHGLSDSRVECNELGSGEPFRQLQRPMALERRDHVSGREWSLRTQKLSPKTVSLAQLAPSREGVTAMAPPDLIAGDGPASRIVRLRDGRRVALRVAGSNDVAAVQQFVRGLSDQSRRNRFFAPVRELSADQLDRVTRSCPPSALALVGETAEGAGSRIVAMAQYAVSEPLDAEFAVVVDDAWQRQGLGIQLLSVLAEHAARAGLEAFNGLVLADNWPMLALLARFDCEFVTDRDPHVIHVVKRLDAHVFAT